MDAKWKDNKRGAGIVAGITLMLVSFIGFTSGLSKTSYTDFQWYFPNFFIFQTYF